jgi:bacterioferritin-associated ferredoxin
MIVCHCHAVSDREVVDVVERGASELADVTDACRAGSDCHGCHSRIEAILDAMHARLVLQDAS